jgi:hypothetical protein
MRRACPPTASSWAPASDANCALRPMITTTTGFAYRIDRWDPSGNEIQHVADVDDLTVALATYEAACERWPKHCLTLRQGSRVIADSRQTRSK